MALKQDSRQGFSDGLFLSLSHAETLASWLDGFTVRNGYMASCGTAVHLDGASLDIRDCVFENNNSGRQVTYEYGTYWTDASSTAKEAGVQT